MRSIWMGLAAAFLAGPVQADGDEARDEVFGEWHSRLSIEGCAIWTETQIGAPSRMAIVRFADGGERVIFIGPGWREGDAPFFAPRQDKVGVRISAPGMDSHIDVTVSQKGPAALYETRKEEDALLAFLDRAAAANQTVVAESAHGTFGIYAVHGLAGAREAYAECGSDLRPGEQGTQEGRWS